MVYCPATPSDARCAVTNPFIFPLFQHACCGPQLWLVEGSDWAAVLCVSTWKGSRYLSGLLASAWKKRLLFTAGAADAGHGAEVMVEGTVLLHEHDDVLDLRHWPGLVPAVERGGRALKDLAQAGGKGEGREYRAPRRRHQLTPGS